MDFGIEFGIHKAEMNSEFSESEFKIIEIAQCFQVPIFKITWATYKSESEL